MMLAHKVGAKRCKQPTSKISLVFRTQTKKNFHLPAQKSSFPFYNHQNAVFSKTLRCAKQSAKPGLSNPLSKPLTTQFLSIPSHKFHQRNFSISKINLNNINNNNNILKRSSQSIFQNLSQPSRVYAPSLVGPFKSFSLTPMTRYLSSQSTENSTTSDPYDFLRDKSFKVQPLPEAPEPEPVPEDHWESEWREEYQDICNRKLQEWKRWERILRVQKHIKRASKFKKELDYGLRKLNDRKQQKAKNLPLYEARLKAGLKEFQELYGRDYFEPLPKSRKELTPIPSHPNYKKWLEWKEQQSKTK